MHALELASQVFKTAFWMRKHLALTWKRTWIWSTSPRVRNLDLGPLLPSEKSTTVKTTRRWTNKDGKKKWQGTRALKGTQYFARIMDLDTIKHAILIMSPRFKTCLYHWLHDHKAIHLALCCQCCSALCGVSRRKTFRVFTTSASFCEQVPIY